jgi:ubiquinone/menaquinone biosynthesis C-methylase UbiE
VLNRSTVELTKTGAARLAYPLSRGLFGTEYAWRPTWSLLERCYIHIFGLVDLPSRLRARVILKEIDPLQTQKILDLGSGTGCYSFYLGRSCEAEISAVDIDAKRVIESRQIGDRLRRGNVKFYLGDKKAPLQNFSSGSFDLVMAVEVLQYLPDVRRTLAEIHRILKPGGYLVGHIPVLGYLRPTETMVFDDEKVQSLFDTAKLQLVKLRPTFGGAMRMLCEVFKRISRWKILVIVLFPFLLTISKAFRVENPQGDYRLFVARKPSDDKGLICRIE